MGGGWEPLCAADCFFPSGAVDTDKAKADSRVTATDDPPLAARQRAILFAFPEAALFVPHVPDCGAEQPCRFIARQPAVPAFRFRRQGNLRHKAKSVLRVVRVDRCPQILKPTPGRLIGHLALTRLDRRLPIVLIRRAGGPIDEVTAELTPELAHRLVTKKVIKIEETDQQKIMLRPGALVVLVLWALRCFVGGQNVGYREDARVSCPDCGCVPSADVDFERLRSAVKVVAAATCADLPATVEDDPSLVVLSKPEARRFRFTARHDGVTIFFTARGVTRILPATTATSRVPAAIAVRRDDKVSGPSGKKTATASISIMASSSAQSWGRGRCLTRNRASRRRLRRDALLRVKQRPRPQDWADDEAMMLIEAVAVFFPDGPLTLSSLRTAIAAGTLEVAVVAGKILVTPRAVKKMVTPSCRAVKRNRRASGLERTTRLGSSSTVAGKSAQVAAATTLTALRRRSKSTSADGTQPQSGQLTRASSR